MSRWFRFLVPRRSRPAVRRGPRIALEGLEGREVPTAVTVTVGGKSNIYGAGLTTPPSPGGGGGGVLPTAINLSALGDPARVEFPAVTGSVSGFVGSGSFNGPDGGGFFGGKTVVPAHKGISGIRDDNAVMFLVGVFLGPNGQPAAAPAALNVSTANANPTASPLLGQQFFIGNGKSGSGVFQNAVVPAGAAKLYLGFAEGFGFGQNNQPGYYDDNGGSFSVTADSAPYDTVTAGGMDNTLVFSPAAQTISLSATVDGPAGPATGGVVTFTVLNGTAVVGTATAGAATNGTASVSYAIPGGTPVGTYSVQAVYGGTPSFAPSAAGVGHVVNVTPGPLAQFVVLGGGQSAAANTPFAGPISVQAADQYGNGVAAVAVAVTGPTFGAGGTFSAPPPTDAQGFTTFAATANTAVGTYTVMLAAGGVAQTITLTNTAGPPAVATVVAGGGQSIAAGGVFGAVVVSFVDAFGNPVGGAGVTLASVPTGLTLPTGLTTAADGTLIFTPASPGVAGTFTVVAAAGGASVSPTLTVTAGPPAGLVLSGGGGQTAVVDAGFALPIRVTLRDAFNNPVAGLPVTVTRPAAGPGATFGNPGNTDASGAVSFAATANTVAGAYTVIVSAGSLTLPVVLTNAAGPPAAVTVASGAGQTIVVGFPATLAVVFAVSDSFGNPVDPRGVTFAGPSSGPSAAVGPVTPTGVPGQGRVAVTANAVVGNYTITIAAGTATAPLGFGNVPVPVVPPPPPPPVALRGTAGFAVGTDVGGTGAVDLYNADESLRTTAGPFGGFTGGVRTAAADFNGDGVADVVAGTGPGRATRVVIVSGKDGVTQLFAVDPFEAAFTGGVYVSAGDLNGDGTPDLIITPDEGGGPRVDVYSGNGFGKFASFFGIDDPAFRGGARAGTGDLNGDGRADLVVVAGFGGGPRVAGFDGKSVGGTPARVFADFFAFEQTLRNGIFVAVGDINGDGSADLICGGGPGGGPRVLAFSGKGLTNGNARTQLANFFAGDVNSRGGIRVAAKDLDGDDRADLVVGAGAGAGSRVTSYLGKAIPADGPPAENFAFDAAAGFRGGVFVG